MGRGTPGLLASISLEEPSLLSSSNMEVRVKNKGNSKAASKARRAGAKTRTEIALQSALDESSVLNEKLNQYQEIQRKKANLDQIMDGIGGMPPEKMFSEEGFNNVKRVLPSLDREAYFNALAPNSARRALITKQLSVLPMGTTLPEATLNELKAAGIDNPNSYMNLSVTAPPNTILGAIQQTAMYQAEQRDGGALAPYGAGLKQKQDSMRAMLLNQLKLSGPLSRNEKANLSVKLSERLTKDTDTVSTLFEFWNNIQDLSDPNTAKSTVKLDGGDVVKVKAGKSFQNVRDIGLVYSFIKMLDPNSVVREGEIKISKEAQGMLQAMGIGLKRMFTGETLDARQRAGILSVANTTMVNGATFLDDSLNLLENQIDVFGLERRAVINEKAEKIRDTANKIRNAQLKDVSPSPDSDVLPTTKVRDAQLKDASPSPNSGVLPSGIKWEVVN